MGSAHPLSCSCGEHETHVVARRRTADGISVCLWSDGSVTGWASALPGVPVRRPRSPEALTLALRAGWLFCDAVALYDVEEASVLYRAAEVVARRGGQPGDVRAEFALLRRPKIHWTWITTAADRDGEWAEQYMRLDRLRWPGMAVLRTRSGYELGVERDVPFGGSVFHRIGFRFGSLDELTEHLFEVQGTALRRASREVFGG